MSYSDEVVKQRVLEVFKRIENAKSNTELESIFKARIFGGKLELNRVKEKKFPRIDFSVSKEEMMELRNRFEPIDFNFSEIIRSNHSSLNSFEKLLLSILWKQGDLGKEKHIINGILDNELDDSGFVFYQFGKYLRKAEAEPIIDQHVYRAFMVYMEKDNIISLRKKSEIRKSDFKPFIKDYKCWLDNKISKELKKENDYLYYIDLILFALGKTIKLK